MIKGPLVKAALVLATALIAMSFIVALLPGFIGQEAAAEMMMPLAAVVGAVAVCAVVVLAFMYFRMRGA